VHLDCELINQEEANALYNKGTESIVRTLFGAIKVKHIDAIAKLFEIANELVNSDQAELIFYPISSGNNWGYGTSLPNSLCEQAVILDLSALNKIEFINEYLGIVRIEPGVTQGQLSQYLIDKKLPFLVPVTGAGSSCSILSNALERGYGITPHQDHFMALMDLKAFLPNGQHYQSPLSQISANAGQSDLVNQTYKWNVGPYIDGLFTQSGLGIVYEATIRLKRLPPGFDSFYINYENDEDIETATKFIKETLEKFEGIVGSINLMDKLRVISMVRTNPNLATGTVLSAQQIIDIGKQESVPAWTIVGSIYGEKSIVKQVKKLIRKAAKSDADKIIFSSDIMVKSARAVFKKTPAYFLPSIQGRLGKLAAGIEIMKGTPNEVAKSLCYWRSPMPNQSPTVKDPAKDKCGLLWYAPLIPMSPQSVIAFTKHVRTVCRKHGIDPLITFTNLRHDLIDSTVPVLFDQTNDDAIKKAHACLAELVEEGIPQGFIPYRLNIEQQLKWFDGSLESDQIMQKIYEVFDIHGINQIGRYGKVKKC
jgi:hypothetical protein